jgi:hypothetical protein
MRTTGLSVVLLWAAILVAAPSCGGSSAPGQLTPDAASDVLACVGGTTACGATCADLRYDPANCGACGVSCGVGGVCVNATCGTVAPLDGGGPPHADAGEADAGRDAGAEAGVDAGTDASTDAGAEAGTEAGLDAAPDGSADSGCAAESFCGGACVDTTSDSRNCGACGAACLVHQVCSASKCECAPGAKSCKGSCVDTAIDPANCGGCGSSCPAGSVCTDGVCGAATSDWPTFGYSAQHAGENTVEMGVPPAIDSWQQQVSHGAALHPVTVESGRAFVTYEGYFAATSPLVALDVSDGSPLWTYNFGAVDSVGHPSVASGVVYVETNHGTMGSSYLWAIDAAGGTVKWASAFASQWEQFWAPAVVGSSVFMDGGEYGGLYGFNVADGSQIFFNGSIGQYDSWSPAFFGGHVYTFIDGNFSSEDPATGSVLTTVQVMWNWTGYSMNTAPVFGSTLAYLISPPNLFAIDPAKGTTAWTSNGTFSGTPAVSGGAVYGISAGNLVARDATTGALLWTFVGDQALKYPPVVAHGFVYVSSDANVYAVNTATHAQALTAPAGGWLTLAARRLLVAGADGVLRGFVLSP